MPVFTANIPTELKIGDRIEIGGKIKKNARKMSVNLCAQEGEEPRDVVLHFDVRFHRDNIISLSRKNGLWIGSGNYDTNYNMFVPGTMFRIIFEIKDTDVITIYCQGKFHSNFLPKIPLSMAKYIVAWADIQRITHCHFHTGAHKSGDMPAIPNPSPRPNGSPVIGLDKKRRKLGKPTGIMFYGRAATGIDSLIILAFVTAFTAAQLSLESAWQSNNELTKPSDLTFEPSGKTMPYWASLRCLPSPKSDCSRVRKHPVQDCPQLRSSESSGDEQSVNRMKAEGRADKFFFETLMCQQSREANKFGATAGAGVEPRYRSASRDQTRADCSRKYEEHESDSEDITSKNEYSVADDAEVLPGKKHARRGKFPFSQFVNLMGKTNRRN